MDKIYLLLSQSGTLPSRILKCCTGAEYNHISLGFSKDLLKMYSFGRRYLYLPIPGGMVSEGRDRGIYGRFPDAKIVLLELETSQEKKELLAKRLEAMYKNKKKYHYNLLGVGLAAFRIPYQRKGYYYCSEFVRDLLVECGILKGEDFQRIVQPVHFLKLQEIKAIFCGKLSEYSVENSQIHKG